MIAVRSTIARVAAATIKNGRSRRSVAGSMATTYLIIRRSVPRRERATRPERAGEAASEAACKGVRGAAAPRLRQDVSLRTRPPSSAPDSKATGRCLIDFAVSLSAGDARLAATHVTESALIRMMGVLASVFTDSSNSDEVF